MNKMIATITSITTSYSLAFLELDAAGISLGMVLFDLKPEFVVGTRVHLLFKETEVALGVALNGGISFCNQFPARIESIRRGKILSFIELKSPAGPLGSVITTRSADRLRLKEGMDVTAIVKASQISMEACHEY
jgi:molybdopterin-binding protein